jgi:hypothetical protein
MNGLKEMAIEAGMHYRQIEDEFCKANADGVPMEMLEAFAKLVAAKEREACAKVCEDKDAVWKKAGLWRVNHEYKECADAIRARGDA